MAGGGGGGGVGGACGRSPAPYVMAAGGGWSAPPSATPLPPLVDIGRGHSLGYFTKMQTLNYFFIECRVGYKGVSVVVGVVLVLEGVGGRAGGRRDRRLQLVPATHVGSLYHDSCHPSCTARCFPSVAPFSSTKNSSFLRYCVSVGV